MKRKKAKTQADAKLSQADSDSGDGEPAGSESAGKPPKPANPNPEAGWKGFCSACASILGRELTQPDAPVLAETQLEQKLRQGKAELKEKRIQALENKVQKDKGHALPDVLMKNLEVHLRKYATQGVVRLFNAVKDYQAHTEDKDKVEKYEFNKMPLKQRGKLLAKSKQEKFEKSLKKAKAAKSKDTNKARQKDKNNSAHNMLDEFG
ncbi:unnamed protein product [Effrenium voratum]|nr:unnamed protein product [Effrenium voratum]